jgi:hypothetical protein
MQTQIWRRFAVTKRFRNMTRRFNGGVRGKLLTVTSNSASGMWDLLSAHAEKGASTWPSLAIYAFTNATFTTGGLTGRIGPDLTQARSGLTGTEVDSWKNNTSIFNMTTNGIQQWTVPATAIYRFNIAGAKGGNNGVASFVGGQGANFNIDLSLTESTILNIVVGQQGVPGVAGRGGGGGGGTFVYTGEIGGTGLIAAAGGGGGSDDSTRSGISARDDFNPTVTTSIGTNNGLGGTSGQGSGAGWLGDGTGSTYPGTRWIGGSALDTGFGGFGGGGGDGDDGGAAGGFTGGGGQEGGGAGGSYYAGLSVSGGYTSIYSASNFTWNGTNNDSGFVSITKL